MRDQWHKVYSLALQIIHQCKTDKIRKPERKGKDQSTKHSWPISTSWLAFVEAVHQSSLPSNCQFYLSDAKGDAQIWDNKRCFQVAGQHLQLSQHNTGSRSGSRGPPSETVQPCGPVASANLWRWRGNAVVWACVVVCGRGCRGWLEAPKVTPEFMDK